MGVVVVGFGWFLVVKLLLLLHHLGLILLLLVRVAGGDVDVVPSASVNTHHIMGRLLRRHGG